ncbi:unnamed protein product [Calypogeia fissa]
MLGVARFFWQNFVTQARQFLESLSDSDPKQYCHQVEIVNLLEALYLYHTKISELTMKYLPATEQTLIAGYFFDDYDSVLPIEEVLRLP